MTKRSFTMRACSVMLTLFMLITLIAPIIPTAAADTAPKGNGKKASVSTAAQLEAALKSETEFIRITADFELDRTFYVSGVTTIYSKEAHTLKRAARFGGDLFVIGEDASGNNALLGGANAVLTLGDPDSDKENLLVLDGNKDAMKKDVVGTVLFVCNSSYVNLYDNVTIQNAHKVGNKKTRTEDYCLSYPDRIGGAAAIIAEGTLNMYGGNLRNNSANEEGNTGDDEVDRYAALGGAIYNYSNLNLYGGVIENNHAARGGAIYNYRTLNMMGTTLRGNTAQMHGGAVYQAGSQYAQLRIGEHGDTRGDAVLFENNYASKNGGAIYSYTHTSMVIYGRTTFLQNHAAGGNGGAICTYSGVNVSNATFRQNIAATRGAGVYISNSDNELTTRVSQFAGSLFEENEASNGAAITLFASDTTIKEGGKAIVDHCDFVNNRAVTQPENTSETDFVGGAMYISRKSTLTMNASTFQGNTAQTEGGALYVTGGSKVDITATAFTANEAVASGSYGGAITVRSSTLTLTDSSFDGNKAAKNGGALYIAYVESSSSDADVTITNSDFTNNTADSYGGAIYSTTHVDNSKAIVLDVRDSAFEANAALKGGAVYLTSGTDAYMNNVQFTDNTNTTVDHDTKKDFNGGALYLSESTVEINGATFSGNTAAYNGGAIGAYSDSHAILNNITATANAASNAGGFLYNSGSVCDVYNSNLTENTAQKTGGAMSLHSEGTTNVYATTFKGNTAVSHGGAVYVYTGASNTLMQDCTFLENVSEAYGGAVYASNASLLQMYNTVAKHNQAGSGGVLYETTTDTVVTINGLTVAGNTATDAGPIIFGNTTKAKLYLNKTAFVDEDQTAPLDDAYWASAIVNKLTVADENGTIPSYTPYTDETPTSPATSKKKPVSVQDVLSLGQHSSDAAIDDVYGGFRRQDNSSNFMSRNTTYFNNINGNTVSVDTFVYYPYHKANNTNVGEGLLIYQALLYKQAHPNEEVSIDISSFRFSIEAAVNINRNSRYFGYMRNLIGQDYDEYGFVRVSYLLITAAKMGIHVNVIGQLDGYPISSVDPTLKQYFKNQLNDPCDPSYVKNGVIGDYLTFRYCYWTSYNDNDATDMMHTKMCAVSHYLDMNGEVHRNAVWSSSANLDGIEKNGQNGNSKVQTASIVSDHEQLYRTASNYLRLITQYCGQEDVYVFRDLVNRRSTEQIDLILAGKGNTIPKDEQIVYLGTDTDDVFELYFAPFGGSSVVWDETYNPYCKYLRKLYNSDDYILFTWNNANYNSTFSLGKQMETFIEEAFHQNKDPRNKIYLNLEDYDGSAFKDLVVGKDIGFASFNQLDFGKVHNKDLQLSYGENGKRHYVTMLNSMNIHGGSMYYQSNFMLVIKETACTTDSVFYTVADLTAVGVADTVATDTTTLGREFSKSDRVTLGDLDKAVHTVEAVVQLPKSFSGRGGVIVGNYNNGTGNQLNLEIYDGGKVRLFFNNGSQKESCIFNKDIRSNTPVHLAVTVKDRSATLYLNGERAETRSLSASYKGAQQGFCVGGDRRDGNTCYFNGTIYSVALFDDVRTADEIRADAVAVPQNASGLLRTMHFSTDPIDYTSVQLAGRTFSAKKYYAVNTLPASPHTIEAVVQVPKTMSGRAGVIVGNYNNGTSGQLNLEIYEGGKVRLFFYNNGKKTAHVFKKDIRSSTPTHLAVTVQNREASLYVNGELTETVTLANAFKGATQMYRIGGDRRAGNTQYFKGTIYQVNMFRDVRTAAEIKQDCIWLDENASQLLYSRRFTSNTAYAAPKINGREFTAQTSHMIGDLSAAPYTIEATVQVPKTVSGRAGVIVGNYTNGGSGQLNLEIYEGGKVRLFFHNGSKKVTCLFSKDIRSDNATHLAVTVNGKTATLYVNGKKIESKTLSATYKTVKGGFKIGGDNRATNTQYFKGTIYSVSLFSDVRSAAEIKHDMTFVPTTASALLYTTMFSANAPTYRSGSLAGGTFSAVKTTALPALTAAPQTIEAVISLPKTVSGRGGVIVGNYNNGIGRQLNLEIYDGGKVRLYFFDGNHKVSYIFSQDVRSLSPTHLAVTLNGTSATLYINGKKSETASFTYAYAGSNQNYLIGGDHRSDNSCYFKGTVYSVALFDDVRTGAEIKQDMIAVPTDDESVLYAGTFLI